MDDEAFEAADLAREEQDRQALENVLAHAARWFAGRGRPDVALAIAEAEVWITRVEYGAIVSLEVPEDHYRVLREASPRVETYEQTSLDEAFSEAIGYRVTVEPRVRVAEAPGDWRDEMRAGLSDVRNQGSVHPRQPAFEHRGLLFRSHSEVVVAQELDRRGVLYFPLPAAVAGKTVLEPDFLVIHHGRAGILEVHGEPYHPATRRVQEDARALVFERAGVRVHHFDAARVRAAPAIVVDEFLALLRGPSR